MPMAVDITPERVAAAAARLHDGGWSFTPRQLYYAVCRDVETPPLHVAPGELSLGALLVLVGAITGNRVLLAILGALGLLLLVIGAVTHVMERRPLPDSRLLVTSYDAFVRDHVDGRTFDGLLDPSSPVAADPAAALVVVCDRDDTAAMLHANRDRIGPSVSIATEPPTGAAGVVVVHDASPAGCGLVEATRRVTPAAVDAGLNPGDVIGTRPQLIEGAAVHIGDTVAHLAPHERDFLRDGKRVELATLSPEETVLRVRACLSGSVTAAP